MANLFLTGSGVPTNAVGEVSDYYRDLATNNIYYYAPTGWEAVPSLIPTPDGVGTNWLFGTGAPNNGIGATNDYYRDDANGIIYRKHAVNGWESKGSLDFIGVYGVQWGEGTGAPANTEPLNNLPAGSFYLDVATSNIYYKDGSLTWSLKGQLGGGGGEAAAAAKAYADTLVIGLLDDRGNYDPTDTSLYPTTGGSGEEGAVLKGDLWTISDNGNVNDIAVTTGDTLRALVDAPGQNDANWAITQNNLSYVPENSSNKATSLSSPDDTKYPTTLAVSTELGGYATKANQRYQFVSDGNPTYTVPASAVTENGRTIIELSNNSLTSITIDTNTGTGRISGDSVNISITGTYGAQELVAEDVTLQGDLTFSYQHQTKTLVYKGSDTWKVVG